MTPLVNVILHVTAYYGPDGMSCNRHDLSKTHDLRVQNTYKTPRCPSDPKNQRYGHPWVHHTTAQHSLA